jgi:diguanylate cyclase
MDEQSQNVISATQRLLAANVQLRDELQAARSEIESKQRELESSLSQARTDTLTGLRNRRAFDEELKRLFAQRQRQGIGFSLLLIDVDHFKDVNDQYGHPAGDATLRHVAEVLAKTMRAMDIICRYGGEEFAVICPGAALSEATIAAQRAREAIATTPVVWNGSPLHVTTSSGVAEVAAAEIADALIARTDQALYAAKQAGRNSVFQHAGLSGVTTVEIPASAT